MLEKSSRSVFEIPLLQVLHNLPILPYFVGTVMPKGNIAVLRALKLAAKEAKRAQTKVAAIHSVASHSQASPIDLDEPHANTDFLDIPCTPVAPTNPAAAEAFETPAATLIEEDAA